MGDAPPPPPDPNQKPAQSSVDDDAPRFGSRNQIRSLVQTDQWEFGLLRRIFASNDAAPNQEPAEPSKPAKSSSLFDDPVPDLQSAAESSPFEAAPTEEAATEAATTSVFEAPLVPFPQNANSLPFGRRSAQFYSRNPDNRHQTYRAMRRALPFTTVCLLAGFGLLATVSITGRDQPIRSEPVATVFPRTEPAGPERTTGAVSPLDRTDDAVTGASNRLRPTSQSLATTGTAAKPTPTSRLVPATAPSDQPTTEFDANSTSVATRQASTQPPTTNQSTTDRTTSIPPTVRNTATIRNTTTAKPTSNRPQTTAELTTTPKATLRSTAAPTTASPITKRSTTANRPTVIPPTTKARTTTGPTNTRPTTDRPATSESNTTVEQTTVPSSTAEVTTVQTSVSPSTAPLYATCTEARLDGAAPVQRGEPGYSLHLDRDADGVACE